MSSGSFYQASVLCPYYKYDNGKDRIVCEGLIPGSKLQSYFRRKKDYQTQIIKFCCGCYWNCEMCAALDKKYEEE